jgi:hypothetical protein
VCKTPLSNEGCLFVRVSVPVSSGVLDMEGPSSADVELGLACASELSGSAVYLCDSLGQFVFT